MGLYEREAYSVDVGTRLRQLREDRNMSMRSLATASGLSANALSMIERGRTSPSVSTLYKLADALEVPITAFFRDELTDFPRREHAIPKSRVFGLRQDADLATDAVQQGVERGAPEIGVDDQRLPTEDLGGDDRQEPADRALPFAADRTRHQERLEPRFRRLDLDDIEQPSQLGRDRRFGIVYRKNRWFCAFVQVSLWVYLSTDSTPYISMACFCIIFP